jgi:EF hand
MSLRNALSEITVGFFFFYGDMMKLRTLVAVAVAAAFAVPISTYAQSSGQSGKQSSSPSAGAPATPSAGSGAMDKDKDGSISKDEAKGTPLEKDFAKLDKNNDGKLSASEQAGSGAGAGGTAPKK